jgi:hypothetical protein
MILDDALKGLVGALDAGLGDSAERTIPLALEFVDLEFRVTACEDNGGMVRYQVVDGAATEDGPAAFHTLRLRLSGSRVAHGQSEPPKTQLGGRASRLPE